MHGQQRMIALMTAPTIKRKDKLRLPGKPFIKKEVKVFLPSTPNSITFGLKQLYFLEFEANIIQMVASMTRRRGMFLKSKYLLALESLSP